MVFWVCLCDFLVVCAGFVGLFSADGCLLFGFGFLICFRASVTRRFGFRVSGVADFGWFYLVVILRLDVVA